ncbi:MAG: hypothetical protein M1837_005010 [Sclerophora amabilis]|nr:MAG: hypothetical protein M1837_005010 [Sclerophora amabilis]
MAAQPIQPFSDPRVRHCRAQLNGRTYHYLLGQPSGGFRATVFLIHGWPDLSFGWRYQIPTLVDLGLRVVCPDSMGYGGTDAPKVPPESISLYGFKRAADDMKELARQLGAPKIILGGHDWGGAIVQRIALHHPELVSHLFSICTPYFPPSKSYKSTEEVVRGGLSNFTYQIQLSGPEVEANVQNKDQIRLFLNAMYGGTNDRHEAGFSVLEGVLFDKLPTLRRNPLLTDQVSSTDSSEKSPHADRAKELDYYAEQFSRNGLHGPLNWYRTRQQNFDDEINLDPNTTIDVPFLFIQATKDAALPPAMSRHMAHFFPHMTKKNIAAGHWVTWQKPEEVNGILKEWISDVVFSEKSRL